MDGAIRGKFVLFSSCDIIIASDEVLSEKVKSGKFLKRFTAVFRI